MFIESISMLSESIEREELVVAIKY
jgi:hypothetical protein